MKFVVVSLFPEMFAALTDYGITGRAVQAGLIEVEYINPRTFTVDRHRTVDDKPYGGGPGMLMKVEPLQAALRAARQTAGESAEVVYLTPQGQPLTQAGLTTMSQERSIILLAGRYEGIDERLIEREVDRELSIGDYVLSGGELPAMVVMDGVTRLLPGALGDESSAALDSFSDGLLDYPQYTRPELLEGSADDEGGRAVPSVLTSGNHGAIARWRKMQALGRTHERRPDLLAKASLDDEARALLNEYLEQAKGGESRDKDSD